MLSLLDIELERDKELDFDNLVDGSYPFFKG